MNKTTTRLDYGMDVHKSILASDTKVVKQRFCSDLYMCKCTNAPEICFKLINLVQHLVGRTLAARPRHKRFAAPPETLCVEHYRVRNIDTESPEQR